jgi:hypothetical protein
MTTTEISPSESSRPLAHSINSVCREANCGRTKVYEAINDGDLVVTSGKWLEFEGGVISGLFNQPEPALSRRRRSRHDDG